MWSLAEVLIGVFIGACLTFIIMLLLGTAMVNQAYPPKRETHRYHFCPCCGTYFAPEALKAWPVTFDIMPNDSPICPFDGFQLTPMDVIL